MMRTYTLPLTPRLLFPAAALILLSPLLDFSYRLSRMFRVGVCVVVNPNPHLLQDNMIWAKLAFAGENTCLPLIPRRHLCWEDKHFQLQWAHQQ